MHESHVPAGHGHQFPIDRRHVLIDEERNRWMPPEPLLKAAGISAGDTVVEVGAGNGFWTLPLARLVGPSGRVIAVDTEPIMLDELRTRAEAEGIENVELVQSEESRIPLSNRIADVVLLAFVLHHPTDPNAFLHEVVRLLKPGGYLVEVDWEKRETEQGPPIEHRLSEDETRSLLSMQGLEVSTLEPPNADVYVMVGRL